MLTKNFNARFPKFYAVLRSLTNRKVQGLPSEVPSLDRFVLELAPDLIHYLYSLHFAEGPIPSIYTVHDQNYEHLPDLFVVRDHAVAVIVLPALATILVGEVGAEAAHDELEKDPRLFGDGVLAGVGEAAGGAQQEIPGFTHVGGCRTRVADRETYRDALAKPRG